MWHGTVCFSGGCAPCHAAARRAASMQAGAVMLVRGSWFLLWTTAACLAHEEPGEGLPMEAPAPVDPDPMASTDAPHRRGVAAMVAEAVADARASADEDVPETKQAGPIPRPPLTVGDSAEPKPDAELFRRAQQAIAEGRIEDARALFLQIIRDYPMSPWVPEVYLAFGDIYFDRGEPESAVRLYERAVQFVDSPAARWARYRLAWCHMRIHDHVRALEQLVHTLKLIEHAPAAPDLHALAVAVRIDLVLAYAEVGKPDKANAFFERLAGIGSDEVGVARQLELLGTRLLELGREPEAVVVCEALQRHHGTLECAF